MNNPLEHRCPYCFEVIDYIIYYDAVFLYVYCYFCGECIDSSKRRKTSGSYGIINI